MIKLFFLLVFVTLTFGSELEQSQGNALIQCLKSEVRANYRTYQDCLRFHYDHKNVEDDSVRCRLSGLVFGVDLYTMLRGARLESVKIKFYISFT